MNDSRQLSAVINYLRNSDHWVAQATKHVADLDPLPRPLTWEQAVLLNHAKLFLQAHHEAHLPQP